MELLSPWTHIRLTPGERWRRRRMSPKIARNDDVTAARWQAGDLGSTLAPPGGRKSMTRGIASLIRSAVCELIFIVLSSSFACKSPDGYFWDKSNGVKPPLSGWRKNNNKSFISVFLLQLFFLQFLPILSACNNNDTGIDIYSNSNCDYSNNNNNICIIDRYMTDFGRSTSDKLPWHQMAWSPVRPLRLRVTIRLRLSSSTSGYALIGWYAARDNSVRLLYLERRRYFRLRVRCLVTTGHATDDGSNGVLLRLFGRRRKTSFEEETIP